MIMKLKNIRNYFLYIGKLTLVKRLLFDLVYQAEDILTESSLLKLKELGIGTDQFILNLEREIEDTFPDTTEEDIAEYSRTWYVAELNRLCSIEREIDRLQRIENAIKESANDKN